MLVVFCAGAVCGFGAAFAFSFFHVMGKLEAAEQRITAHVTQQVNRIKL